MKIGVSVIVDDVAAADDVAASARIGGGTIDFAHGDFDCLSLLACC